MSSEAWATQAKEWGERVETLGPNLSVYNCMNKTPEAQAAFTEMQRGVLFPLLRAELRETDRTVLDFGCGIGRWTEALAREVGGRAIGIDPTPAFLEVAEKGRTLSSVIFKPYRGHIQLPDESVDVIWSCLVLSTVHDAEMLRETIAEMGRVLKHGGLMFLCDNTDTPGKKVRSRWSHSHSEAEFVEAFSGWVELRKVGNYDDLGEAHAIMVGRKR